MPSFLDSRDLRFLIGAGVVMVVLLGLTFALGPAPVQQSLGYPSSYASEWAGAKAAYLLLEEQGYRVERWEKSPEDLPENPDGAVLVLAEPTQAASASELAAIRRFVSAGGRVLAIGASAAALVPDAVRLDEVRVTAEQGTVLLVGGETGEAEQRQGLITCSLGRQEVAMVHTAM